MVIEGQESSLRSVLSDVPQRSVLDSSLFLVYVNDIGRELEFSKIKLFADNAFLYASVNSHSDVHCFQKDLDVLEKWAQQWMMVFNV